MRFVLRVRGFPDTGEPQQDRERILLQRRIVAGNLCQRSDAEFRHGHQELRQRRQERRYTRMGRCGGLFQGQLFGLRCVELGDEQLVAAAFDQLLSRQHAQGRRTGGCVEPLRGCGAFLPRAVLLRQGAYLRCRALVREIDRGDRPGGALQGSRQPRIRLPQDSRRSRLRLHLLLDGGFLPQPGVVHPSLRGPRAQSAFLPLRGDDAQIPHPRRAGRGSRTRVRCTSASASRRARRS